MAVKAASSLGTNRQIASDHVQQWAQHCSCSVLMVSRMPCANLQLLLKMVRFSLGGWLWQVAGRALLTSCLHLQARGWVLFHHFH